jgi:hypothetical protein
VRAITNGAGAVTQTYTTDEFGVPTQTQGTICGSVGGASTMTLHRDKQLIQDVLAELDSGGEPYRILSPQDSRAVVSWLNRYPESRVAHVDWSSVPGSICRDWDKWGELVTTLDQICEAVGLDDPPVVIWQNALSPCLELPLSAARRHAMVIFRADPDVWIACPEQGWSIEKWHEGTLCFGRALEA